MSCQAKEAAANFFQNLLLNDFGGTARIDRENPLRFAAGDGQVCVVDATEKFAIFLLKTVFIGPVAGGVFEVAPAGAVHAVRDFGVHQDGEVGLESVTQHAVELKHGFRAESASATLVGLGRVGEPVAEDPSAGIQSGQDELIDLLGARGEHERKFSPGR